jgi:hypothetical protein
MFDPWTATDDEAIREQESRPGESSCRPLAQCNAARMIEAEKAHIEAGDGFAVLACIRHCVTHGLVAPVWLAYAFNQRYDSVLNCRADSWDDPQAFGRPYPKGKHLNALRKARVNRFAVLNAVNAKLMSEPETAIDKRLFESIGKPLGLGSTSTEELYYQALKITGQRNTAKSSNFAGLHRKRRR